MTIIAEEDAVTGNQNVEHHFDLQYAELVVLTKYSQHKSFANYNYFGMLRSTTYAS